MNAYELAKLLDFDAETLNWKAFKDAANMLRQQADRIAELEKDGKVCATCGGLVYDPVLKQTKPLSDEEIEYYEHLIAKLFNVSIQQKVVGLDRIIRAIEERHGIK